MTFLRDLRAWSKLAMRRMPKPTVLMYHSIGEGEVNFTVAPSMFRRQLDWLAAHGWQVVPLDECVRHVEAGESGKFCALTFDDGYRDFLTAAWPELERRRLPATVFVIAGRVGETNRTSDGHELPLLTWDELADLRKRGVTVGSHALTHAKLTRIPVEEARRELTESKRLLSERLGLDEGVWLCYPSGKYDETIMGLARAAGYAGAVSVIPGHPDTTTDHFAVPRAYVHRDMGMTEFSALFV